MGTVEFGILLRHLSPDAVFPELVRRTPSVVMSAEEADAVSPRPAADTT